MERLDKVVAEIVSIKNWSFAVESRDMVFSFVRVWWVELLLLSLVGIWWRLWEGQLREQDIPGKEPNMWKGRSESVSGKNVGDLG